MVDWNSVEEVTRDAAAFQNLMHALLGLYIWEWVTSLDFEWSFITGRKRFRWPIIFYLASRYSLLFAMVGIAIALNVKTEVNCQALYTYNSVLGNASIGLASINLSLRTMAVWEQKWYIVAPLVAVIIGHWSLLLHGVLLTATWVPGSGCLITGTDNTVLAASFIYTMSFDALILFLTAYKLATTGGIRNGQRSRLVDMIFGDGLIYFAIALTANIIATTFMLLDLNAVMSIIFNVPSAIASTIVATRAVRRLSNFLNQEPERFASGKSTLGFTNPFRRDPRSGAGGPGVTSTIPHTNGSWGNNEITNTAVTVKMETFTQASYAPDHMECDDDKIVSPASYNASRSDFDIESGPGPEIKTISRAL